MSRQVSAALREAIAYKGRLGADGKVFNVKGHSLVREVRLRPRPEVQDHFGFNSLPVVLRFHTNDQPLVTFDAMGKKPALVRERFHALDAKALISRLKKNGFTVEVDQRIGKNFYTVSQGGATLARVFASHMPYAHSGRSSSIYDASVHLEADPRALKIAAVLFGDRKPVFSRLPETFGEPVFTGKKRKVVVASSSSNARGWSWTRVFTSKKKKAAA